MPNHIIMKEIRVALIKVNLVLIIFFIHCFLKAKINEGVICAAGKTDGRENKNKQ